MKAALLTLVLLAGCTAAPDWSAAAQQALADGRASLAALGTPEAAAGPAPREPGRIRPLRTANLPAAAGTTHAAVLRPPAMAAPETIRAAPSSAAGEANMPVSAAALGGAGPERLVALLGEPALRRAEGPVSIWLYSAAGCQLDVMFYPSAEGPRVAHVQARAGGFAQRTEAACLRDLATQARRPPAGPRQGRLTAPEPVG